MCNGSLSEDDGISAILSNPSATDDSGNSTGEFSESSARVSTNASSSIESPIGSKCPAISESS